MDAFVFIRRCFLSKTALLKAKISTFKAGSQLAVPFLLRALSGY